MCCLFLVKAIFVHDEVEGLRRNSSCVLLNMTNALGRKMSAFSLAVFSSLEVV